MGRSICACRLLVRLVVFGLAPWVVVAGVRGVGSPADVTTSPIGADPRAFVHSKLAFLF